MKIFSPDIRLRKPVRGCRISENGKRTTRLPTEARTSTFDFKVDGAALTGKLISARGDAEIKDGKVKGDEITFFVIRNFNGDDVKINYKGKVSGDSIQFNVQFRRSGRFEITAKRLTT